MHEFMAWRGSRQAKETVRVRPAAHSAKAAG
jgi:hypothetical protein